jgi:signal transduction histidine kinase
LNRPARAQTAIAPRLQDLGDVLGKINSEKTIAFVMDVPADWLVACEQQDFDEMAGNLLDNAFKWARGKVSIRGVRQDALIALTIEDDGRGLSVDERARVLRPGERLDESAPGFGFGLSITRELAELYGGDVALGASPLGGLCVTLRLPAANAAESR